MRLISRADLARLAGVSKAAITKACDGKLLGPACQGDGVDAEHPLVATYLKKRGKKLPPPGAARPGGSGTESDRARPSPPRDAAARAAKPTEAPTPPAGRGRGRPRKPTVEDPDKDVGHMRPPPGIAEGSDQDLKQLTDKLLPLVERFGTDLRFEKWLSSIADIELIREKRLKNGQTEGGLISRELVRIHVMGAIDAANKRLLGDASKTITARVANVIRGGGGLEEAQRYVREEISKQLKPVKDKVARNLRQKTDGPKV